MKKFLCLIFLICNCANAEPIIVKNPDCDTKIEIPVPKNAKNFAGQIEIQKGSGEFVVILCDSKGKEIMRQALCDSGYYDFGALNAGKYYLKLENTKKAPQTEDKAAQNIFDIPFVWDKTMAD